MKIFNKILCILLLLAVVFTLSSCGKTETDNEDLGNVEGYYSALAYEVKGENDVTTELVYLLYETEELVDPIGQKSINLDTDGNVEKYTVVIGVEILEQLISYTKNENGEFYSDIVFSDSGKMVSSSWENITTNAETGEVTKDIGSQEFYENGNKKLETIELYTGEKLTSKTVREYNEAGELVNETLS
ncbi:MAG: hypothetical protein IJ424_07355 [Oscillospiraceae bacterium]|nr:hypothetical protein [Oscillospiraceae bacterium]